MIDKARSFSYSPLLNLFPKVVLDHGTHDLLWWFDGTDVWKYLGVSLFGIADPTRTRRSYEREWFFSFPPVPRHKFNHRFEERKLSWKATAVRIIASENEGINTLCQRHNLPQSSWKMWSISLLLARCLCYNVRQWKHGIEEKARWRRHHPEIWLWVCRNTLPCFAV